MLGGVFWEKSLAVLLMKCTDIHGFFLASKHFSAKFQILFWNLLPCRQNIYLIPAPQKSNAFVELLHSWHLTRKWKLLSSDLLKFTTSKQLLMILEKFFHSSNSLSLPPDIIKLKTQILQTSKMNIFDFEVRDPPDRGFEPS